MTKLLAAAVPSAVIAGVVYALGAPITPAVMLGLILTAWTFGVARREAAEAAEAEPTS